VRSNFTLQQ